MKLLLIVLLLIAPLANAWEQSPPLPTAQCRQQVPFGLPTTSRTGKLICRSGFVTLNDTVAKLPIWVAYALTPDAAIGCVPRSNNYTSDKSIDAGSRAEPHDYAKSGYDMGHLAPAADFQWNTDVQHESFILSNMAPQLPGFNRLTWKTSETSIRGWVSQRNHAYVIYDGPIYSNSDASIGDDAVVVPHAFFKIVIDTVTHEAAGFLFPHQSGLGTDLLKSRALIIQIEYLAGIKFAYPLNTSELPLDKLWSVDFGVLTKAKQAECKSTKLK